MKGLLAGLLALVFASHVDAKALAYVENKVGGRIVLTDQEGCPGGMLAYTQDAQGMFHTGCWTTDFKTKIFIKWIDVDRTIEYKVSTFRTLEDI